MTLTETQIEDLLKLTPRERLLYEATEDGKAHTKNVLKEALGIKESDDQALYTSVYCLNIKLNSIGQVIISQNFGRSAAAKYMRVIKLNHPLNSLSKG